MELLREKGTIYMSTEKKKSNAKSNQANKKFHSKNIKHDPSAESARAKFGLNGTAKDKG